MRFSPIHLRLPYLTSARMPCLSGMTQKFVDRTYRWLVRCKEEMARLNASGRGGSQSSAALFGINQEQFSIRIEHARRIVELELLASIGDWLWERP